MMTAEVSWLEDEMEKCEKRQARCVERDKMEKCNLHCGKKWKMEKCEKREA